MEPGSHSHGQRPHLITQDPDITSELLRLAAAAGIELEVLADAASGRGAWGAAPLILIGADLAGSLAALHVARRPGVVVVSAPHRLDALPDSALWRDAVAVGAEQVVQLPDADGWLIKRLGETADGPSRGGTITAVTSATGGSGASTLAAGLALASQESSGRALLIDGDSGGGGIDLLLGSEEVQGIRWPDLAQAEGRVSAVTLDYALPHAGGLAVLSHGRMLAQPISQAALSAVIDSGVRGYHQIVIDAPRSTWESAPEMLERADRVLLVVPARVRAIAAAAQAAPWLRGVNPALTVIVRSVPKGVAIRDVERALAAHDLLTLPDHPALATRADRGEPLLIADAYGRAVRSVLSASLPAAAFVA